MEKRKKIKRIEFTRKKTPIKRVDGKKSCIKSKIRESVAKLEKEYSIELMLTDWSIKYPDMKPGTYLREVKCYGTEKTKSILNRCPAVEWYSARNELLDGITRSLVKRQIDWAAEMHDLHFQGSKVALSSVMDWLGHQAIAHPSERDIKMIKVALESIQIAQKIQRTALGLPTDDGAIHIYNNLIMQQKNVKHELDTEKTPVEMLEKTLTYDEIKALIEVRRMEKSQEAIDIAHENVQPS